MDACSVSNVEMSELVSTKSSAGLLMSESMKARAMKGRRMMKVAFLNTWVETVAVVTSDAAVTVFNVVYVGVGMDSRFVMQSVLNNRGVAVGPKPSRPTILSSGLTQVPPRFLKL